MLDGATLAPTLLLFFQLIVHGEFFCTFHVDETCFKMCPWNIVHAISPCKNIIVYLLFDHYFLVEGSQSLGIILLIVLLVLVSAACFCLQELLEGLDCLHLHQMEHLFTICLEPKDGEPHNAQNPIIKAHDIHHHIVLAQRMLSHCSLILFFVSNICSDSF